MALKEFESGLIHVGSLGWGDVFVERREDAVSEGAQVAGAGFKEGLELVAVALRARRGDRAG